MGTKQIREYLDGPPETGHSVSQPAAKSEKGLARDELASLLGSLWIEPVLSRGALIEEVKDFLRERSQNGDSQLTDRTLWSYVRRYLTNYDEIRAAFQAKVGESELYDNVKVYLCCRIIREYGLQVDPVYAAFGESGAYGEIPSRFLVDNLEATATRLILQELLRGSVDSGRKICRPDAGPEMRGSRWLNGGRPVGKEHQVRE